MRNALLILSALALLACPTVLAEEAEAEPQADAQAEPQAEGWSGDELTVTFAPDLSPLEGLIEVDVKVTPKELVPVLPGLNPCILEPSPCVGDIVCKWDGGYGDMPVRVPPNGIGIMVGPPSSEGLFPWFGPYHGYGISTDGGC